MYLTGLSYLPDRTWHDCELSSVAVEGQHLFYDVTTVRVLNGNMRVSGENGHLLVRTHQRTCHKIQYLRHNYVLLKHDVYEAGARTNQTGRRHCVR